MTSRWLRAAAALWRALLRPGVTLLLLLALLLAVTLNALLPPDAAATLRLPPILATTRDAAARALMAATAVVLAAHWLHAWIPSWAVPAEARLAADVQALPYAQSEAWQRIVAALALSGQRLVRHVAEGEAEYGAARDVGPAHWLRGLLFLGLLLVMGAVLSAARWGWRGEPVELVLGEPRVVDEVHGYRLMMHELEMLPDAQGNLADLAARLAVGDEGDEDLARLTLAPGRPAFWRGLWLHLIDHGPALRIGVWDERGTLALRHPAGDSRTVWRLRFSERQQEHVLLVDERDLLVRLVYYTPPDDDPSAAPAVHLALQRGRDGALLGETLLTGDGRLTAEEVTAEVRMERYLQVQATRNPSLPLAAAGGLACAVGALAMALSPPRRTWVALAPLSGEDGPHTACTLYVPPCDLGSAWYRCLREILQREAEGDGC